jgi:hypothetical protein
MKPQKLITLVIVLTILLIGIGAQIALADAPGPDRAISPNAGDANCPTTSTKIYQSGNKVVGEAKVTCLQVRSRIRVWGQLHVGSVYYGTPGDVTCRNVKSCTLTVSYIGKLHAGEKFAWYFNYD